MKTPGYRQKKPWVFLLVSFIMLSPSANANALGVRIDAIPSLRLEEEWRSTEQAGNEVSYFGTRVSPGLGLTFTAPDEVTIRFSGTYEKTWYHGSDARNADESTWHFRIDSTGAWRLTPKLSVQPSVYYLSTPSSYRRVQLVPSGDPLVPPTTITNYATGKTQTFGGGLAVHYLASPNWTIGLSGNYSEQRFPGDSAAGSGLTDAAQAGGGVSISHRVSPRTNLGVAASGSHQTYDNNASTDTLSGGIKYGYQFSPVVHLDATVGGSRIRRAEAPGVPGQSKSSPSGSFNLSYLSDSYTANLFGSYTYSGGSGFGEATRQGTVGLSFINKLTREWSWSLAGTYQVSRSVFNADAVNINTIYAKVGTQYRLLEWITMDLSGDLDRQTSEGVFGSAADNYSVILGVNIAKPFNIY